MRFLKLLFAFLPLHVFSQCDMEIAGFDPVTLDISIIVNDGYCGSETDSIGEFLLTLTFDPSIPNQQNPFFCFNSDGTADLLFPLNFPFIDIGQGVDNIIQSGDTLTFNLIESQPLGLGTTLCWQEAIASGAFDSCIVLYINQINDSGCLDENCEGLGGFDYPDDNTEDNTITFSLTDACGGLPSPPLNYGCTDPLAVNFDIYAEIDDGSCEFEEEEQEEEEEQTPECNRPKIFVPNAFTPNNDGTNDYFQVQTIAKCFIDWETKIYNRWGQVVWKAESPDDKWYGEGLGQQYYTPDGAYIYTIDAIGKIPSATQQLQGHVTIFR